MNPTIREIVLKYLKENGYDGLCNNDCGCGLNDLMPCDGKSIGECRAGYSGGEPDNWIYKEKPCQHHKN